MSPLSISGVTLDCSPLSVTLHDGFERVLDVFPTQDFVFVVNGEDLSSTVVDAVLISPTIHERLRSSPDNHAFKISDERFTAKDFRRFLGFVHSHSFSGFSTEEQTAFLAICAVLGNTRLSLLLITNRVGSIFFGILPNFKAVYGPGLAHPWAGLTLGFSSLSGLSSRMFDLSWGIHDRFEWVCCPGPPGSSDTWTLSYGGGLSNFTLQISDTAISGNLTDLVCSPNTPISLRNSPAMISLSGAGEIRRNSGIVVCHGN
jgi:hypothetical protein